MRVTFVEVLVALVILCMMVYGALHPEQAIQYRDNACVQGCHGSPNPDACYQVCMFRQ